MIQLLNNNEIIKEFKYKDSFIKATQKVNINRLIDEINLEVKDDSIFNQGNRIIIKNESKKDSLYNIVNKNNNEITAINYIYDSLDKSYNLDAMNFVDTKLSEVMNILLKDSELIIPQYINDKIISVSWPSHSNRKDIFRKILSQNNLMMRDYYEHKTSQRTNSERYEGVLYQRSVW